MGPRNAAGYSAGRPGAGHACVPGKNTGGLSPGAAQQVRDRGNDGPLRASGAPGHATATLRTPDGGRLVVFLVHLDPSSSDARSCEVNTLLQEMQPYLAQRAILIGDMNFASMTREHRQLEQAGWKQAAVETAWGIDQIWVSPAVEWSTTSWFQSLPVPIGISDHNPIGARTRSLTVPRRLPVPPARPCWQRPRRKARPG